MMIGFAALVAGGIFLGLLLPLTSARRGLVGVCAAGAMALLAGQMAVGFPLAKEADDGNKQMASSPAAKLGNPLGGGGNPFAPGGAAKDNPFAPGGNPLGDATAGLNAAQAMSIDVRYTPWYYLTWGFLAVGLVLVLVEAATGRNAVHSATAASGPVVAT